MIIYQKNTGLFLAHLCMFITSQKMLENSIPFKRIFFNTSLEVPQENKCISIVVVLVFNFKNASRLFEHPIYSCSAQVGGLFGETKFWKRCEKRCEIALKRCEIADIEEFSLGNLCKPYTLLRTLIFALF